MLSMLMELIVPIVAEATVMVVDASIVDLTGIKLLTKWPNISRSNGATPVDAMDIRNTFIGPLIITKMAL